MSEWRQHCEIYGPKLSVSYSAFFKRRMVMPAVDAIHRPKELNASNRRMTTEGLYWRTYDGPKCSYRGFMNRVERVKEIGIFIPLNELIGPKYTRLMSD